MEVCKKCEKDVKISSRLHIQTFPGSFQIQIISKKQGSKYFFHLDGYVILCVLVMIINMLFIADIFKCHLHEYTDTVAIRSYLSSEIVRSIYK